MRYVDLLVRHTLKDILAASPGAFSAYACAKGVHGLRWKIWPTRRFGCWGLV